MMDWTREGAVMLYISLFLLLLFFFFFGGGGEGGVADLGAGNGEVRQCLMPVPLPSWDLGADT